ncbi:MAG: hypothetical protein AAFZ63_07285 [Bacteroidota bacterium]
MDDILDEEIKGLPRRKHILHSFELMQLAEREVQQSLDQGMARREIYENLVEKYGDKDGKIFARIIASALSADEKVKFKNGQRFLLVLIAGSMLLLLAAYLSFWFHVPGLSLLSLFPVFVILFIEGSLMHGVSKFRGRMLYSVMVVYALKIVGLALEFRNANLWMYAFLAVFIATLVVAHLIRKRAFPHLSFSGPRKSQSGTYFFD